MWGGKSGKFSTQPLGDQASGSYHTRFADVTRDTHAPLFEETGHEIRRSEHVVSDLRMRMNIPANSLYFGRMRLNFSNKFHGE